MTFLVSLLEYTNWFNTLIVLVIISTVIAWTASSNCKFWAWAHDDIYRFDGKRIFVIPCTKGPMSANDIILQDLVQSRVDLIARCVSCALMVSYGTRRDTTIKLFCCKDQSITNMKQDIISRESNMKNTKNSSCNCIESKTVIFDGNEVRHVRSHEKCIAAMIKHAFNFLPLSKQEKSKLFQTNKKTKVLRGIDVMNNLTFEKLIENTITDIKQSAVSSVSSNASNLFNSSGKNKNIIVILHLIENGIEFNDWVNDNKQCLNKIGAIIAVLGDAKDITHDQQLCLKNIASSESSSGSSCYDVRFVNVKIGNVSLLASHCIVLFHHYLDKISYNLKN